MATSRRNIIDPIGLSKRRGQTLSNSVRRGVYKSPLRIGPITTPTPGPHPAPGQTPPIDPNLPQHPPVQESAMVPWGPHNQFMGVPKALQYRNQGVATSPVGDNSMQGAPGATGYSNPYRPGTAQWTAAEQLMEFGTTSPTQFNNAATGNSAALAAGTNPYPVGSPEWQNWQQLLDMQASGASAWDVQQAAYAMSKSPAGTGPRPNSAAAGVGLQLGSDGKYHNPNLPLPPGVTLQPPDGATAPLTQPVDQVATAGHGTPQASIAAGKDPTKHIAYWEDKGWTYNPATDQWTDRNAPAGGTAAPAPAAPAPAAAPATNALPLDPNYIAAQRSAQLGLNTTLAGTNPALEQIASQQALAQARLQTNEGVDKQALMESLASRGVLDSSLYGTNLGNLATNYLRQNQDLAGNVADAYSSVYQQQQQAYNDYNQALIEALLASANSSATSPYTPVGRTKPKKPKKKPKGGRRG